MATAKLMPIKKFVDELTAAYNRKDGYIMGSTGQDPKKWAVNSWWFTQYDGNAKQKEKALYWRAHAARVWDCNGLAEGLYKDYSGVDINTKARYNYQNWCEPKGAGMIPVKYRVPGAAVFWGDDNKPSTIHHVGYLVAPVSASKPEGDWYIIEARGVMYGVVKTKLESRKPNFWGWMTKYFDYSSEAKEELKPSESEGSSSTEIKSYIAVTHGNYYVRADANKNSAALTIVHDGDKVLYLGVQKDGWYQVNVKGKIGWLSHKAGSIISVEDSKTLTVKTGSWYVRKEPNGKSTALGVVKGGTVLNTTGDNQNGWYSVLYNGQFGWISGKAVN